MKDGPVERLYFDKEDVNETVRKISMMRHVERYCMLRQWCYGNVIDCACGCGYGSYLISENPDVDNVTGIDISSTAIEWAKDKFEKDNIEFHNSEFKSIPNIIGDSKIDVLVSIETMEHIKDVDSYMAAIKSIDADQLIISFPNKKSTHFNRYHFHDFTNEQVISMFHDIGYTPNLVINLYYELTLLKLTKTI